jgi:hypothetical protein
MPNPHAASVIGDPMPTAIVESKPSRVWHFGLWAAVYQFTRRLAAQKLMLNVVIQGSSEAALCSSTSPCGTGCALLTLAPSGDRSLAASTIVRALVKLVPARSCWWDAMTRRRLHPAPRSSPGALQAQRPLPIPGGTRRLLAGCPCLPVRGIMNAIGMDFAQDHAEAQPATREGPSSSECSWPQ